MTTKTTFIHGKKPERWSAYSVHKDTAYRIKSDTTDQIVSRNHRCLVEREGKLVFDKAERLAKMELCQSCGMIFLASKKVGKQQERTGAGLEEVGKDRFGYIKLKSEVEGKQGEKNPAWKGGLTYMKRKEICEPINKVFEVSDRIYGNGEEGRICNGTQIKGSNGDKQTIVRVSVHHINHNAEDNRIENLILFRTNAEHKRYEHGQAIEPLWQPSNLLNIAV